MNTATYNEERLADIASKSFLDLWTFPSPYRNQKLSKKGDGKELCDLLVVCGDDVLVFSEKTISWPAKASPLAWSRWFKKAIKEAANQAFGAERWIRKFPDQIYLDKQCTEQMYIDLSNPNLRIHLLVVATGSEQASKEHFNGGTGSLMLDTTLEGMKFSSEKGGEFIVGDMYPEKNFIHVFSLETLSIVLSENNTIKDYIAYLNARKELFRSEVKLLIAGEEGLVGLYPFGTIIDGQRKFEMPSEFKDKGEKFYLGEDWLRRLRNEPRYIKKKEAEEISYFWDYLIEDIAQAHVEASGDDQQSKPYCEEILRYMALEDRLSRRILSSSILDKNNECLFSSEPQMRFLSGESDTSRKTGFFIFLCRFSQVPNGWTYEDYTYFTHKRLWGYANDLLLKHENLERCIGLTWDPEFVNRSSEKMTILIDRADLERNKGTTLDFLRREQIGRNMISLDMGTVDEYPAG